MWLRPPTTGLWARGAHVPRPHVEARDATRAETRDARTTKTSRPRSCRARSARPQRRRRVGRRLDCTAVDVDMPVRSVSNEKLQQAPSGVVLGREPSPDVLRGATREGDIARPRKHLEFACRSRRGTREGSLRWNAKPREHDDGLHRHDDDGCASCRAGVSVRVGDVASAAIGQRVKAETAVQLNHTGDGQAGLSMKRLNRRRHAARTRRSRGAVHRRNNREALSFRAGTTTAAVKAARRSCHGNRKTTASPCDDRAGVVTTRARGDARNAAKALVTTSTKAFTLAQTMALTPSVLATLTGTGKAAPNVWRRRRARRDDVTKHLAQGPQVRPRRPRYESCVLVVAGLRPLGRV